jgi:hypothetical protein
MRGAYLAATIASILFLGGLAPSIGMIGGGELGGEGVRTGETGTELPGGKGNNRGFGEKATGLREKRFPFLQNQ